MSLGFIQQKDKMKSHKNRNTKIEKNESSSVVDVNIKLPTFYGGRNLITWLNVIMFTFHATFVLITLLVGRLDLRVPLYTIGYNITLMGGGDEYKLIPTNGGIVGYLYFTWATAAFFALSACFHFGNAFLWNSWYLNGIKQCKCPSRWIEYAFSAALMAILIAYGAGTITITNIISIFILSTSTMFFGYITELLARPDLITGRWTESTLYRLQAHFMGYVPQVCSWFIIIYQFYEAGSTTVIDNANVTRKMPDFVYGIVWSEVFVFWSFGIIQLIVTCKHPRYYPYGEVAYQIMSFFSKGLLGIVLLVNVLRFSSFDEIYKSDNSEV